MKVSISALPADLVLWIGRARNGEEIIVTDRSAPSVRLLAVDTAPLLEQLVRSGVLSRPQSAVRPVARRTARVRASGPVADLVSGQRG